MAWTPKATAPATFNLADAFLALVTGDAVWGWLADWLPFISNDHFNTADFCAGGPPGAAAMTPGEFTLATGLDPVATAALILQRVTALYETARDRVFSAYCEQATAAGTFGALTMVCGAQSSTDSTIRNKFLLVPAGTTHVRVSLESIDPTADGGPIQVDEYDSTQSTQLRSYVSFSIGTPLHTSTVDGPATPGAYIHCGYYMGPAGTHACVGVRFDNGGASGYTATPQPQPAGVLSPLRSVDPSLAGIAAEASMLEFKLDTLGSIIRSIAGATLDLAATPGDPADLPPDTALDVADAVGAVITASGIPASRSLDFGSPQNVVKLGHVNLGSALGWYPSVWLTHSPMVIRPFPPGVTKITVTDLPPGVSVQIAMIPRNK